MKKNGLTELPKDHPLYFRVGHEEEMIENWYRVRRGMWVFLLPMALSGSFLAYWFFKAFSDEAFRWESSIPLSAQLACGIFVFCALLSVIYQYKNYRCFRCQFFLGFDLSFTGLFGKSNSASPFYCWNCGGRVH